jgi:hypothetical protein
MSLNAASSRHGNSMQAASPQVGKNETTKVSMLS